MPNLHELFDAATKGLPPLPDLAPSARRIVRRRQLAARTTAAVLSSALVIGAGTFALAAQHSGRVQNGASQTPHSYDVQYVLDTLRSVWPIKGQQLTLDRTAPYAIEVTKGGHVIGRVFFEVNPDISAFPSLLVCPAAEAADGACITGTASDGDRVLADSHESYVPPGGFATSGLVSKTATAGPEQTTPATTVPPTASAGDFPLSSGVLTTQRLHGGYLGRLTILGLSLVHNPLLSNQQLLDMAKSAAFGQLIVTAIAAGSFQYLGTPPAGVPTYTYGPSPSTSDAGSRTGAPSGTTTPPLAPTTPAN